MGSWQLSIKYNTATVLKRPKSDPAFVKIYASALKACFVRGQHLSTCVMAALSVLREWLKERIATGVGRLGKVR